MKADEAVGPLLVVVRNPVMEMCNLMQHGLLVIAGAERHALLINVGHAAVMDDIWVLMPMDKDLVEGEVVFFDELVKELDVLFPCIKDAPRQPCLPIKGEGESAGPIGSCHRG